MVELRKAVITAAGLGTRLLPSSKEIPKEMFPVYDLDEDGSICVKPVMHKIFENLYDVGFREFCMIVGRGKRSIEDHFTPDYLFSNMIRERGMKDKYRRMLDFYEKIRSSNIFFINQPEPRGFGDAVLKAEGFVGNNYFLLHAGDDLVLSSRNKHLLKLLKAFEELGGEILLLSERVEDPRQYGVIVPKPLSGYNDIFKIVDIVEKPSKPPSNLAVIAIYILSPKIFDALRRFEVREGEELQLTWGLKLLIDSGYEAYAVLLGKDEKRLDVGSPQNYYKALTESYEFCLRGAGLR